jgi:bidirectional [NiFe] hydrogenase diaphorase subunit
MEIYINDVKVPCEAGMTVLEATRAAKIDLPTLCYLEGLSSIGACRLCLVEVEGSPRLFPACTLQVAPNQRIKTDTDKLKRYRKMTVELLFAERNHVCSVCVVNGDCELQELGYKVGMDHVRFPFLTPACDLDSSKSEYAIDQNRCVLCTRCVRVCAEVEGAHNWDVKGRGANARIISDLDQPWAESSTCTTCGKCVEACPVGALWDKHKAQGQGHKRPEFISELIAKRRLAAPKEGRP